MGLLKRKQNDDLELLEDTTDLLILFDDEKKTSEIHRISNIDHEKIYVRGVCNVPITDVEVTNSKEGRHFFYRAPSESVKNVKRLAELEKSLVLQSITNFKPKKEENVLDMTKMLLFGLVIVEVLIIAFK